MGGAPKRRILLAGNLLFDYFVEVPPGADWAPPPSDTPHTGGAEIRAIIDALAQEFPQQRLTQLPGGAPGNIRRVLAELSIESALSPAPDRSSWGAAVTWYSPYTPEPLALRVSPPPPIPAADWNRLAAALDEHTLLYLDGYALPGLLQLGARWFRRAAAAGAALLWDLAHPGVVAHHPEEIRHALRELAVDGPGEAEPRVTVFASAAELAPLGGVQNLRPPSGALHIVYKEPPAGATLYRLTPSAAVRVAQYRGATVTPMETTGLGDAFVAGWIAGLLGDDRPENGHDDRPDDRWTRRLALAHETARRCALQVGGRIQSIRR